MTVMIPPPAFSTAVPSMPAAGWLDEATLLHLASEAVAAAANMQSAKLRIHCLEVAKTYRRLAKMRRRMDQRRRSAGRKNPAPGAQAS